MTTRKQNGFCYYFFFRKALCGSCFFLLLVTRATAQTTVRPASLSILDFGPSGFATVATDILRAAFKPIEGIAVLDPELSRAAARGASYSGSLNMSVNEARDLGAVLSSDFYMIGDAQTLRRSSSTNPAFYESYCSIFIISSRSGKLVLWDRLSSEATSPTEAERQLLAKLQDNSLIRRLLGSLKHAQSDERLQRAIVETTGPLIEEAPDDEKIAAAQGLRLPKPFRRLRPDYPATAAKADAEATVDVVVDVGANGEVGNVEVVRWAGFGLDEATVATVRQLHFFPAMRNGMPVPLRVLLRYNFRKPVK